MEGGGDRGTCFLSTADPDLSVGGLDNIGGLRTGLVGTVGRGFWGFALGRGGGELFVSRGADSMLLLLFRVGEGFLLLFAFSGGDGFLCGSIGIGEEFCETNGFGI